MENVATYTRPPTVAEWNDAPLAVIAEHDIVIATGPAIIYREETHPPAFYFPPEQIESQYLSPRTDLMTLCPFKGFALYFDMVIDTPVSGFVLQVCAWTYPDPLAGYEVLKDHVAVYPHNLKCYVGDERVIPEDDEGFYGGWLWTGVQLPIEI